MSSPDTLVKLSLHEEIMLLALKDEAGTIAAGTVYRMAMGGAILAELLLDGHVEIVKVRRRDLVSVVDSNPTGDVLLDECLTRIAGSKRRQAAQTWVTRFSGIKRLKERVANQLVERGILRLHESTVLLIFKRQVYPELDPAPEAALVGRVREAIDGDGEVDPRTTIIVALTSAANMLPTLFDRKTLRRHKRRIEAIIESEVAGEATRDAVAAVQAAVMTAVVIPSVASS